MAADLDARHRGYWIITWSGVQEVFVALPVWPLHNGARQAGTHITALTVDALLFAMSAQEDECGVRRDRS